jgi:hypothetical protein
LVFAVEEEESKMWAKKISAKIDIIVSMLKNRVNLERLACFSN